MVSGKLAPITIDIVRSSKKPIHQRILQTNPHVIAVSRPSGPWLRSPSNEALDDNTFKKPSDTYA